MLVLVFTDSVTARAGRRHRQSFIFARQFPRASDAGHTEWISCDEGGKTRTASRRKLRLNSLARESAYDQMWPREDYIAVNHPNRNRPVSYVRVSRLVTNRSFDIELIQLACHQLKIPESLHCESQKKAELWRCFFLCDEGRYVHFSSQNSSSHVVSSVRSCCVENRVHSTHSNPYYIQFSMTLVELRSTFLVTNSNLTILKSDQSH